VPDLGWKRDAIPGYINESWALIKEPGIYRGQCTELCGKDHGFMPVVVRALPEAEYKAWLDKMKAEQAPATAMNDGTGAAVAASR
jgi:cytochrome c oxidase subunit 2